MRCAGDEAPSSLEVKKRRAGQLGGTNYELLYNSKTRNHPLFCLIDLKKKQSNTNAW